MIYEILLPLPIQKTFYYEDILNEKTKVLPNGTLFKVEFKKKIMVGIIINNVKINAIKKPLKKIIKTFDPLFFNQEILKSIKFISSYSCNKSSMILKLFLSNFSQTDYVEDFKKNVSKK